MSGERANDPRIGREPLRLKPGVTEITSQVLRIVAPNPSPMTLDGTNTYLVIDEDRRRAVVIDPGPIDVAHRASVVTICLAASVDVLAVITTHGHPDHAAGGAELASYLDTDFVDAGALAGRLSLADAWPVEPIPTPGHSGDHLAFLSQDGVLLTGDHILGRGTTVIVHPDGSLREYLTSLRRVEGLDFSSVAPGHGPALAGPLAREVIAYYLAHRGERIEQLRSLLLPGAPIALEVLVEQVYGTLDDPVISWAARVSLEATLEYLREEGLISIESHGIIGLY
ncbi:MAG: MBL fold metallo-hydrolase [Ferrimicrobium sp.]